LSGEEFSVLTLNPPVLFITKSFELAEGMVR
jgi:hypothetical protein